MKKYFAVLILTAAVVSCGPKIIYPHLEWLIPWRPTLINSVVILKTYPIEVQRFGASDFAL